MAYKVLFFCLKVGEPLKEIGEKLKDARENIGIALEEAAEDLKMSAKQLEELEQGNMEAFKDVLSIKYFIRDYAKYLGLNYEDIVDEFNEYLFDYTSKISLQEIKEAKKKIKGEEEKRIASPYTIEHKEKNGLVPIIIGFLLILLVAIIIYFSYLLIRDTDKKSDDGVVMNVNMEDFYEFAQ